jgi:hypothetical protein
MGWLGPPQLIAVLVALAATASLCGYTASALARRKRRRAKRFFIAGFLCGFTVGVVTRRRWQDIGRMGVRALRSAPASNRLGWSTQRPRRRPLPALTARR